MKLAIFVFLGCLSFAFGAVNQSNCLGAAPYGLSSGDNVTMRLEGENSIALSYDNVQTGTPSGTGVGNILDAGIGITLRYISGGFSTLEMEICGGSANSGSVTGATDLPSPPQFVHIHAVTPSSFPDSYTDVAGTAISFDSALRLNDDSGPASASDWCIKTIFGGISPPSYAYNGSGANGGGVISDTVAENLACGRGYIGIHLNASNGQTEARANLVPVFFTNPDPTTGDPHVRGPLGRHIDIGNRDGQVLTLLSHPNVAVNMLLSKPESDESEQLFITKLAFMLSNGATVIVAPGNNFDQDLSEYVHVTGVAPRLINKRTMTIGDGATLKVRFDGKAVQIDVCGFRFHVSRKLAFPEHLDVSTLSPRSSWDHMHGVLGQMYYTGAEQPLINDELQFEVDSLESTESFKFNKFTGLNSHAACFNGETVATKAEDNNGLVYNEDEDEDLLTEALQFL